MNSAQLTAIVVLLIGLATGPAAAESMPPTPPPQAHYFRIDWQPGKARNGTPSLYGYVYNDHGYPAAGVKLLIEGLDSSGSTVAKTIGYVDGLVPPKSRSFFEVPRPPAGTTYRVTLHSFEWIVDGDGGVLGRHR